MTKESFIVKQDQKDFAVPDEGTFTARISGFIDLGTQDSNYQGTVTKRPEIMLRYQLVEELHEFDPEKGGRTI